MRVSTAAEMVATAKSRVEAVSAEQLAEEIAGGGVLLVDLREPDERMSAGVIPGAVHVPRGQLEYCADPTCPYHQCSFDPDGRVVLYCTSSGRSALAGATLQLLGYARVAFLDGGIKAWVAAGQPVESV